MWDHRSQSSWSYEDSPYEVLGIDPDADEPEIKRAYRDLVMKYHPDRGGDSQRFRKVQEAYGVLIGRRIGQAAFEKALDEYQSALKEVFQATLRHRAALMKLVEASTIQLWVKR